MNTGVAADAKNRNDMRMLELSCRLGFDLEPLALFGVDGGGVWKDLQSDSPAERDLQRLVNDAHPSASDLAEDVVVAQPRLGRQYPARPCVVAAWPGEPDSPAAAASINSSPEKHPLQLR